VPLGFQIKLKFGNAGFEERGKPEYPEKNLSEQGQSWSIMTLQFKWTLNQGFKAKAEPFFFSICAGKSHLSKISQTNFDQTIFRALKWWGVY